MYFPHQANALCKKFLPGCLTLLYAFSSVVAAQNESTPANQQSGAPVRVTHVLGYKGLKRNTQGTLAIEDGTLQFRENEDQAVQLRVASIQSVFLGSDDKQVGGVPLMLGKAAVPYGGGRLVSLVSHKRFDTITIEYVDDRSAFHGAIFRLDKGQGENLRDQIRADGADAPPVHEPQPLKTSLDTSAAAQWNVQIDKIKSDDLDLDPAFEVAIYENLLGEFGKTKVFHTVFRSRDRDAESASDVLILKTTVLKYAPGSETRRAVTTVSGATKLKVRVELCTRSGQVVADRELDGNVRFWGDNLKATHNLARNVANAMKHATLPNPARPIPLASGDQLPQTPNR